MKKPTGFLKNSLASITTWVGQGNFAPKEAKTSYERRYDFDHQEINHRRGEQDESDRNQISPLILGRLFQIGFIIFQKHSLEEMELYSRSSSIS